MSVMTRDPERGALFLLFFILVSTKVRRRPGEVSLFRQLSAATALYRIQPIIALGECSCVLDR